MPPLDPPLAPPSWAPYVYYISYSHTEAWLNHGFLYLFLIVFVLTNRLREHRVHVQKS
jgi:hypothetical protein